MVSGVRDKLAATWGKGCGRRAVCFVAFADAEVRHLQLDVFYRRFSSSMRFLNWRCSQSPPKNLKKPKTVRP